MCGCDKQPTTMGMTDCPMASREPTFREILDRCVENAQERLRSLERLRDALPVELPHEADRLMRSLLLRSVSN